MFQYLSPPFLTIFILPSAPLGELPGSITLYFFANVSATLFSKIGLLPFLVVDGGTRPSPE